MVSHFERLLEGADFLSGEAQAVDAAAVPEVLPEHCPEVDKLFRKKMLPLTTPPA